MVKQKLVSDQDSKKQIKKFRSFNTPIIGASYEKSFFSSLTLTTGLSYEFSTIGSYVRSNSDKKVFLYKNYNEKAKVDWSGIRLKVGVAYSLNKKIEEK